MPESHKTSFYVSGKFEPTYQKLKEILEREGISISDWIEREATEYVSIHWPGNPQVPIDRYARGFEPPAAPKKLCPVMEVHCQGTYLNGCRFSDRYRCRTK